jgi:hypothetical protein
MRFQTGFLILALVAAIPAGGQSPAAARTSEQIITHHLASIAAQDLEGVLGDYSDTATVITPRATTTGKAALRKMFGTMLANPQTATQLTAKVFTDSDGYKIGYIVWVQNFGQPNERRGTDSFFILDGKIVAQTAALIKPTPTAPPQ